MQQTLQTINDIAMWLGKPKPQQFPDPVTLQLNWNGNVRKIWVNLLFMVIFPLFAFSSHFSAYTHLVIIGGRFLIIGSYIVLCRSHVQLWNPLFTLGQFLYEYNALDFDQDGIYYHIACLFIYPIGIATCTGDYKMVFMAACCQTFTFRTKLKDTLATLIREEDPEIFADRFLEAASFYLLFILLVVLILVITLQGRTIELGKTKNALEAALEQQRTFILSFSHELRNPINSLLGNLQLVLQGEPLSAKTVEMLNIAKACGEILLHNINNVLDTGKQEIGKLEVNPILTQLHEVFQRTWSIYGELLKQKKLKSQLRVEKGLPIQAKLDYHKVNQILLNLIGNAIKFTEKGSVGVTIQWLPYQTVDDKCFEPIPYDDDEEGLFEKQENLSTMNTSRFSDSRPGFPDSPESKKSYSPTFEVQKATHGVLKIIVKDTGSGMKKEALQKLFKKFSQVSENVSQRSIGTGLGLYITKEICQAMHGEIRAYSKPGVGSTFVVCIPTVSVPLDSRQRADSMEVIRHLSEKSIKALVADDSPFNVNLTSNYFSQFGGSVVSVAYNGYDAFLKYRECRMMNVDIDVITLDIDMPIMDGKTACDKIREYEQANKLKPVMIILISGNYDKEQIDEYLNYDSEKGCKADCFLRKPVSFSEFYTAIYDLIPH